MCRYYKKSYAYSARSEHPAHGVIGLSMGSKRWTFYNMGRKLRKLWKLTPLAYIDCPISAASAPASSSRNDFSHEMSEIIDCPISEASASKNDFSREMFLFILFRPLKKQVISGYIGYAGYSMFCVTA